MQFNDTVTIKGINKTKDGYLAASAIVARTGIQLYTGDELGKPEMKVVKVYRPVEEVFDEEALKSYAHRPITDNHPSSLVDANNWKKLARGQTGDEIVRDGQSVRVSMLLMDSALIDKVEKGKREISMGYTADIEWTDGVTPDGEYYDAIQRNLRMNHLAIVAKGRAGSEYKLGDNTHKGGSAMGEQTTLVLDGITVSVPVSDAANVKALFDAKDKALTEATASLESLNADAKNLKDSIEKLTGEKAVLEKQIADNAMTPEKLTEAVNQRASLIADAKAIVSDANLSSMTDVEIKRAVVTKVLGDSAKEMSDAAIDGAYAMAAKSIQTDDPVRSTISDGIKSTRTNAIWNDTVFNMAGLEVKGNA